MAEVGSITNKVETTFAPNVRRYRMSFTTSSDTGAVSGIDVAVGPGMLLAVKVIPVTSGGTQPSNLFDVTLLDGDAMDLLSGRGTDCVNTGPTLLMFDPPVPFPGGNVQPTIANGGNSKAGQFELMVRYAR